MGKKVFARRVALFLLLTADVIVLLLFVDFSVGILGSPLSPRGFLMYLLVVHISSVDISSK